MMRSLVVAAPSPIKIKLKPWRFSSKEAIKTK